MNVILVDENLLLISALKKLLLLNAEVNEVAIYADGRNFLEDCAKILPDIIVIDFDSPTILEMSLLETCRSLFPEAGIIALSVMTDVQNIKLTIKHGANGVLSKSASYDEFEEAIIQVSNGKQYMSHALRDNLVNSVFADDQIALHLSPREKEVLQKVCSGRTIKEIAYDLKLSAHTIQYYHRSVMDKCKVKRTTDLIVYAIQHRLYIPDNK